jgi:hypothetical protein
MNMEMEEAFRKLRTQMIFLIDNPQPEVRDKFRELLDEMNELREHLCPPEC